MLKKWRKQLKGWRSRGRQISKQSRAKRNKNKFWKNLNITVLSNAVRQYTYSPGPGEGTGGAVGGRLLQAVLKPPFCIRHHLEFHWLIFSCCHKLQKKLITVAPPCITSLESYIQPAFLLPLLFFASLTWGPCITMILEKCGLLFPIWPSFIFSTPKVSFLFI